MDRKTQGYLIGGFIILVIIAVIAAAIYSGGVQSNGAMVSFNATKTAPITTEDHTKGPKDAKVSLIEYGDFQCPACGAYEPIVEQLEKDYDGRVQFVFRNFPLTQLHQDAMTAAEAAEAAALQGKYWEMHDLLYQNQSTWSEEPAATVVSKYFNGYAQSLGMNVQKFDSDITSAAVKQRVQRDIDSGNAAKIDHTPTFFINLTQIENPTSLDQFKQVLDTALASSTATGTSSAQ